MAEKVTIFLGNIEYYSETNLGWTSLNLILIIFKKSENLLKVRKVER
jgi:hypothetical protein